MAHKFLLPLFDGLAKSTRIRPMTDFILGPAVQVGQRRRLAVIIYLPDDDVLQWLPRLSHFDPIFAAFKVFEQDNRLHAAHAEYQVERTNGSLVVSVLGRVDFPQHVQDEVNKVMSTKNWSAEFKQFIDSQPASLYPQDIEKRLKKRMDANLRSIFG